MKRRDALALISGGLFALWGTTVWVSSGVAATGRRAARGLSRVPVNVLARIRARTKPLNDGDLTSREELLG